MTAGMGGTGGKTGGGTGGGGNTAGRRCSRAGRSGGYGVDRPALDAPIETGGSLLANGASCSSGSQCQIQQLRRLRCCDSACSGQCQSCGEAASLGKCVTISGAVRGQIRPLHRYRHVRSDLQRHRPGPMSFPGSEKQCADPTCTAGVAHAAAKCDGAGNCPAGAMTNCDPFLCGATACKTTCATSADCTTASYCAAPNCVAKKASGPCAEPASNARPESAGDGAARLRARALSRAAGNLFKNAGFDSDVSSWDRLNRLSIRPTGIQWIARMSTGVRSQARFKR